MHLPLYAGSAAPATHWVVPALAPAPPGANVLVTDGGVIKLADFGAVKRLRAAVDKGSIVRYVSGRYSSLPSPACRRLAEPLARSPTGSQNPRPGDTPPEGGPTESKREEGEEGSSLTTGTFVGTPLWTAPEVLRNDVPDAEASWEKADIWSVGCTVVEMATGRTPWVRVEPISLDLGRGATGSPR